MNFDRFKPECECSMKHEKPESFPDDYKPQCECNKPDSIVPFRTERSFSMGLAERKPDGTVRGYVVLGRSWNTWGIARTEVQLLQMDYARRGIGVPPDEFCVIEHKETFYLV